MNKKIYDLGRYDGAGYDRDGFLRFQKFKNSRINQ